MEMEERHQSGNSNAEHPPVPPGELQPENERSGFHSVDPELYVLDTKEDIPKFLRAIQEPERKKGPFSRLPKLLEVLRYPVTIVCEYEHVDRSYRDTYYTYFSGKHEKFGRNCKRLSFFDGSIDMNLFYCHAERSPGDCSAARELQKRFIGACVLKPIVLGKIGRTVLDPSKLNIRPCYLKTTAFHFNILGHALTANGFPFCSQDTETMTCAQITIWDILEYYGTLSAEYSSVLPSQITGQLEKISNDRVIPARGMTYKEMSHVLKVFGFASKLYGKEAYKNHMRLFRRFFHYYVASGVPLAVGVSIQRRVIRFSEIRTRFDWHSIVCIGHGEIRVTEDNIAEVVRKNAEYLDKERRYPCIDSADLYDHYVVMDDNSVPYGVLPFDKLIEWNEKRDASEESDVVTKTKVSMTHFAVPLYRRVFLTADTVPAIVRRVLQNEPLSFLHVIEKLETVSGERIGPENPLVLRIFLALSTNYKNYRAVHAESVESSQYYSLLRMPRYVWVAEIATYQSFRRQEVYGEMVIDATASSKTLDGLLMIRYLNQTGFCAPEITDQEQMFQAIHEGFRYELPAFHYRYPMYRDNLREIAGDCPEDN